MNGEVGQARRERSWAGLLTGRSSRKEYWLSIAIIMTASFVLSYLPGFASAVGLTVLTVIMQIRRAHDLGRSGWWGVLAQAAPIAVVFLPISYSDMALFGGILAVVTLIILGAIPGNADENRFGPPPPTQLRAMFQRR